MLVHDLLKLGPKPSPYLLKVIGPRVLGEELVHLHTLHELSFANVTLVEKQDQRHPSQQLAVYNGLEDIQRVDQPVDPSVLRQRLIES